jgi:broad specificity phosphatase PhoE
MPQTDIYLIRHGETFGNIDQLFCGHSETALTPRGIAQAAAVGRRLADVPFVAAYASDLSRAADTARHALGERGIPLKLDTRLREMHYGEWESLPGKQLEATHRDVLREFFQCRRAAPGGETVEQLRARMAEAVAEIVDAHRGSSVMVVSHGNAMMGLMAELLALPVESTWSFAFENTSVTRLHFSRSGRLTIFGLNDASHIHGIDV